MDTLAALTRKASISWNPQIGKRIVVGALSSVVGREASWSGLAPPNLVPFRIKGEVIEKNSASG